tara:strand:- start:255 stop:446 length:192 start_codon:yes stop_codon:yes gene_type:complete
MKKSKEPTLGDFMEDIGKIVEHLNKLNGPQPEDQDLTEINKDNEEFLKKYKDFFPEDNVDTKE